MARRSISRARLSEQRGEPLEQGRDVVEHLYLLGIGTRASLLPQPRCLISVFLSVMHGEPINTGLAPKVPPRLQGETGGQVKTTPTYVGAASR
jgi:hypothetical protein